MANALYYKYKESVSQGYMLVLEKPGLKPPFYVKIGFLQSSENKLSSRRLGEREEVWDCGNSEQI